MAYVTNIKKSKFANFILYILILYIFIHIS